MHLRLPGEGFFQSGLRNSDVNIETLSTQFLDQMNCDWILGEPEDMVPLGYQHGCDLRKNKRKKWAHHCIMALPLLIKSKAATIEEPNLPQGSPHPSPQK
jgi:hypothetical protein